MAFSTRWVRRALLAVVLAIGVSVVWTYHHGPASAVPAAGPSVSPILPRTTKLTFQSFSGTGDEPKIELTAETLVGKEEEELRLGGVNATFHYLAQGQTSKGYIVSDECIYTPTLKKAVFQGHVKLTTADGLELRTESLVYRGDKDSAHSNELVEFKRGELSGRSMGLVYEATDGKVEFPADVVMHIEQAGKAPAEIQSAQALIKDAEKTMSFGGGVTVTQGGDRLTSERFEADFGDDHVIYRARAIEKVVLDSGSGSFPGTGGGPAEAQGPRKLTAHKLDIWVRPDHTISEALAGPDAELTLMPGPKSPPERRKAAAKFLKFVFDEKGQLREFSGDKEASMVVEPLAGSKTGPQHMSCGSFLARLDPATGEIQTVELEKDLVFSQGAQHGTAQRASYEGAAGMLRLADDPVVIDDEQRTELRAVAIDLMTRSGDVAARGDVRHLMKPTPDHRQSLLGGGEQPVQITSGAMTYTAQDHLARYRPAALLRSGQDEVRAPELQLQDQEGHRRLEATGGVSSLLHPKDDPAAAPKDGDPAKPPSAVETKSRTMTYDESARQIVYKGEVVIRQADIETRSPEAVLKVSADGDRIDTLEAGEPVDVRQGARRARGRRGVYTPADQKMVLTGDRVVLTDPDREVHGRSVVFHVGDDRIVVDGQGGSRTRSILRGPEPGRH